MSRGSPGSADRRWSVPPGAALWRRLEALRAEDSWWDEFLPAAERPAPPQAGASAHWASAFCAAAALHLAAFGALSLLHRDGVDAPSPGAGASAMDVVMLPAWPEPGQRLTRLGVASAAKPSLLAAPVIAPPAPLAAASPAAYRISDQLLAKPPPVSDDVAKPALVATAAAATPAPQADLPPSAPSAAETVWEGDLLAKLASLKHYPAGARRAGQQDTVLVRFVVDRNGQALSAEVIKSKGFAMLDDEATALIRRASPLPPPPAEVAGDAIELIAPIQFVLHSAR